MTATVTDKAGVAKTPSLKVDKGIDIREGAEYRTTAQSMEIDDSVGGLDKSTAAKLHRAIEETFGERTATTRQRDGSYRVWRVAERQERKRKAKE